MWFNMQPLGIGLSVSTWLLMAFADWTVVRFVLVAWLGSPRPHISWLPLSEVGLGIFIVYQSLIACSCISHIQAMTTDPGTVSLSVAPTHLPNPRNCRLCQGRWKPSRAHHCKTCDRCIFRMDHHCPWINNCVGLRNQKYFVLFLGYTGVCSIITFLMLICGAVCWLASQNSWEDASPPGSTALLCSGLVAVECLAAVLFVADFLKEQIESIQLNSTLVETYQRTHGERTTFMEQFKGVFGYRWYLWPWPVPSVPTPDYTEPAIPDDDHVFNEKMPFTDDGDGLGIAGDDTEDDNQAFSSAFRGTWSNRTAVLRPRQTGNSAQKDE